jgi:hypothetical protein
MVCGLNLFDDADCQLAYRLVVGAERIALLDAALFETEPVDCKEVGSPQRCVVCAACVWRAEQSLCRCR